MQVKTKTKFVQKTFKRVIGDAKKTTTFWGQWKQGMIDVLNFILKYYAKRATSCFKQRILE